MAYSSDINIRLAQIPKTTDPALFPDMVEIYNAIHILAQYLNQFASNQGGGEAGTPPWESMPFRQWFWSPAAEDITAGDIVSVVGFTPGRPFGPNGSKIGVVKGAPYGIPIISFGDASGGFRGLSGQFMGVALEDTPTGSLVKVGVGPSILKVEGIEVGTPVYTYSWQSMSSSNSVARDNRGKLITSPQLINQAGVGANNNPSGSALVAIGQCVAPDSVLIFERPDFFAQLMNEPDSTDGQGQS